MPAQGSNGLFACPGIPGRQVQAQRPYNRARCNDAFLQRRRGSAEPAAVADGIDARDSGLAMLVAHGHQVTTPLVMVVPATQAPEHLVVRLKAVADADRVNLYRAVCRPSFFTHPDERRYKPTIGSVHRLEHPPIEHRYAGSAELCKVTQSVQGQARRRPEETNRIQQRPGGGRLAVACGCPATFAPALCSSSATCRFRGPLPATSRRCPASTP